MNAADVMVGWTTTPTPEDARRVARGLLDASLAACVQISGPITSIYRWEGRTETATEFRVTVKFASRKADAIASWLQAHHGYDSPQWVCCRAASGAEKYLKWVVDDST